MFELTLSIDIGKQKYLHNLQKNLTYDLGDDLAVMVFHNENGRSYLAIAVSDNKKEYLKAKILSGITEIIVNVYKHNFFKEKLELSSRSLLLLPFLKAISIFDSDSDYEIIKKEISLKGEVLIDSFFYFKLQGLKHRWGKTAEIIIRNGVSGSDSSMVQVLKYLTENSENFTLVANVFLGNERLQIKNYKGTKNFRLSEEGISNFLTEIISLNPLKINLTKDFDDFEKNKAFEFLEQIFGEKIYVQN